MKTATAFLDYQIDVDCPHCNESVDLVRLESDAGDNTISGNVFQNRWHLLKGYLVECPHCKNDFELAGLEY